MKRILGTILAACVAASAFVMPAAAYGEDKPLRVGIYYGSSALAAPQLQNFAGSGYQAGYYDSAEAFHSLYPIGDTKVVMLKDENYIKNADGTYAESNANPVVGAYHVQLEGSYSDAAAAKSAADAAGGFAAYVNGAYYVRKGSYASLAEATAAGGGTAVGGSKTGVTVAATETGKLLFEYDGGELFAMAPQGEKPVTWFKGYKYYGNFVYQRTDGSNLSVINYVGTEDYVKGVIPYEMSASWPAEALKAQAICARSEALVTTKHAKLGFDVCATTDCQVYQGLNRADANSDKAVDDTAGVCATVNGKVVGLYYFSSDGGATEDAINVWGGDYSYLKGKADPYEMSVTPEKNAVWSVTMTADEAAKKVRSVDSSFGTLQSLAVTKLTDVGNVLEVTAIDTNGKKVIITKAKCRGTFGLNSQRYTITAKGGTAAPEINSGASSSVGAGILSGFQKALGGASSGSTSNASSYTFNGTGWGHHVGMSQYGALAMAQQGKSYEDILNFYFTGITLAK